MGLRSIAADMGIKASMRLEVDASAAVGVVQRKGLGKLRHIDVNELWLQDQVEKGMITIRKIPGACKTADVGTKPLSQERFSRNTRWLWVFTSASTVMCNCWD